MASIGGIFEDVKARGDEAVGLSPVNRGHPGFKHHLIVDAMASRSRSPLPGPIATTSLNCSRCSKRSRPSAAGVGDRDARPVTCSPIAATTSTPTAACSVNAASPTGCQARSSAPDGALSPAPDRDRRLTVVRRVDGLLCLPRPGCRVTQGTAVWGPRSQARCHSRGRCPVDARSCPHRCRPRSPVDPSPTYSCYRRPTPWMSAAPENWIWHGLREVG